jgi:hypothetical protein
MKVVAALVFSLFAVGQASAARFLEVPAPAKRLEVLLGTWKGDAVMTVNGRAITWKAKWSCAMNTGGWGVTCKLSGRIPGLGQYDETDVFGYDDESDLVHWFSTTSRGEVHDHAGRWTDGKTLQLDWQTGGKRERLVMAIEGTEVVVKSDVTSAGKPSMSMVLRLRR